MAASVWMRAGTLASPRHAALGDPTLMDECLGLGLGLGFYSLYRTARDQRAQTTVHISTHQLGHNSR